MTLENLTNKMTIQALLDEAETLTHYLEQAGEDWKTCKLLPFAQEQERTTGITAHPLYAEFLSGVKDILKNLCAGWQVETPKDLPRDVINEHVEALAIHIVEGNGVIEFLNGTDPEHAAGVLELQQALNIDEKPVEPATVYRYDTVFDPYPMECTCGMHLWESQTDLPVVPTLRQAKHALISEILYRLGSNFYANTNTDKLADQATIEAYARNAARRENAPKTVEYLTQLGTILADVVAKMETGTYDPDTIEYVLRSQARWAAGQAGAYWWTVAELDAHLVELSRIPEYEAFFGLQHCVCAEELV